MIEYYRGVKKGLGAAAALSAAQRNALAAGGAIASPAVWGAYVAIGDGAAAPRLSSWFVRSRVLLVALALAAVVLGAFVVRGRRR
jgi:hypothetical protein